MTQQIEKRIELPKVIRLTEADAQEAETIEAFSRAPKVTFICESNPEFDHHVYTMNDKGQRVLTKVCHTININGLQFFILPGKNTVPQPVYEHFLRCQAERRNFETIRPNEFGNLGPFVANGGFI